MSYPNLGGYNSAQMSYGGDQPGGYGGQHPGGYPGQPGQPGQPGGYGGAHGYGGQQPGNFPPQNPSGVSPEVQQWFNAVDRDQSGKITAKELQAALVNGQGKNFSDQACNLMIGMFDFDKTGMFDLDKTGTIDIKEFQQLYNYINQWLGTFRSYDRDQSGHVEEAELAQAFQQMGFRFTPEFIKFLITKSDMQNHSKISVDQFIVLCVQIQRFTENSSSIERPYDKSKRKRKHKGDDEDTFHFENGLVVGDEVSNDDRCEFSAQQNKERWQENNEKLKMDMNQLINENVHLLKENKQLQEDNCNLVNKVKTLQEENECLRKEQKDALELSVWLNSAKEIVKSLKQSSSFIPLAKKSSVQRPTLPLGSSRNFADFQNPLNDQWSDVDISLAPKMENIDEELLSEGEQETPYHTPLLNFDQVEFEPLGDIKNSCLSDMTPLETTHDEVDLRGRNQLLFPHPVEGVCELCPGLQIYVALTAKDTILSKKSHSSVARSCLEAIFKMPFLLSCSVQGNVAKGPYGKPEVQRPPLYRPAVECILKYARNHAEQNGWKVEENTTIKKQMNTRLSELRNIAKYKTAFAEVRDPDPKGSAKYRNSVAALAAIPVVSQISNAEMLDSEPKSDTKASNLRMKNSSETT